MRQPNGSVQLENLMEALNSLPEPTRREVLEALRVHDRYHHYFTQHDGRIEAERVDD